MLSVRPMNETTVSLYNRIDNRYLAEERVRFYTEGHEFSLEYTPLNEPQGRTYPPDAVYTAQDILQRKDAVCFFAYWGEQPAGQAVVTAHWNHLAFLWDIRVDVPHRNKGVGRALLSACAGWARDQKLKGLFVET